jgi:hypothetical protein
MNRRALTVLCLLAVLPAGTARAAPTPAPRVLVQVMGGAVLNADSDLSLVPFRGPALAHRASWESRSLEQPFYWCLRLRWQRVGHAFELQLLHHKMHLANPTPTIRQLEVTHGFNIVSGHYVRPWRGFLLRAGAGVVLPKTDADIDGVYGGTASYRLQGWALLVGAGREWTVAGPLSVVAEAQGIAARTAIDVPGGTGTVRHLGLHLLAGLGLGF